MKTENFPAPGSTDAKKQIPIKIAATLRPI